MSADHRSDRSTRGGGTEGHPGHRSASRARAIKSTGLLGFVVLAIAIVLLVLAIGATAGHHAAGGWLWLATVIVGIVGLAMVATGRVLATSTPAHERPQEDPLQPEVTAEDEENYRQLYRRGRGRRR
ncbi:hypothetical protein ACLQ3C_15870 [Gordonia sp. DT30]|uniref:hypothetical protein n=1 Tax=Gordonia sp. DT30 TaxID=3416546 RepID=UPI003CF9FF60